MSLNEDGTDTFNKLLQIALTILTKYPLCDSCLGRQFAALGRGITNKERGFALKLLLTLEAHRLYLEGKEDESKKSLKVLAKTGHAPAYEVLNQISNEVIKTEKCYICSDIMKNLEHYVNMVITKLKGSEYDFNTILIGCRMPLEIIEREDRIRSEFGLEHGESIKKEFNREVGKLVQKALSKQYDTVHPDMIVIVDLVNDKVELEPSPLFIYGRYKKLVRGIPQNKWIVFKEGKRIRKYKESIEELIALPILEVTKGAGYKFHGAGREDVDARMLGNGRPFVIEIKRPKVRDLDLKKLEEIINQQAKGKVEVTGLQFVDKRTIRKIKTMAEYSTKTYRALVELEREIKEDDVRKLEDVFKNLTISQRTPRRVLHRRADKIRKKKVYELKVVNYEGKNLELLIRCQGGLYIKELIHGDEGRTKPSIAEVLDCKAKCLELDVIDVEELL